MSHPNSNKPKLKIVHLADLHLGYRRYNKLSDRGFNQREIDVSQAFREAVDRTIAIKPDLVLVAGDVFHSVRPSNAIITFAFREFRRLAQQTSAPIVILAGNHDTPKRVDSGSLLKLFQELDQVYISDHRIEKFEFPQLQVAVTCLPHAVLAANDQWSVRADDNFTYNILLTHAQIGNDFFSDFGGANLNFRQFVVGEWDYIALGHVHVYQELAKNMAYAGATEHTAKDIWREANFNKGFLEINLPDHKKTFYTLTSVREVVALRAIDVQGLSPSEVMDSMEQALASVSGGIAGKIIRIDLLNLGRQTYALLDHQRIRLWRAEALNLMIDYRPPAESTFQLNEFRQQNFSLRQELIDFCQKQKGINPEIPKQLCAYLDSLEATSEAS